MIHPLRYSFLLLLLLTAAIVMTAQAQPTFDWREIGGMAGGSAIEGMHADSSGGLWLLTGGGLYRSTNDGRSWDPVPGVSRPRRMDVADDGAILVTTFDTLLHRSDDLGRTWDTTLVRIESSHGSGRYVAIDRVISDPSGAIFIGRVNSDGETVSIYRSTDGAKTWSPAIPTAPGPFIGVDRIPGHLRFHTTRFTHVSTDGGSTWAWSDSIIGRASVVVDPSGRLYGVTTSRAVPDVRLAHSSDTGRSWSTVAVADTSIELAIGSFRANQIVALVDSGLMFFDVPADPTDTLVGTLRYPFDFTGIVPKQIVETPDGTIMIVTATSVYRWDGDNGWIPSVVGVRPTSITDIALSLSGNIVVSTRLNGIYTSTDDGASWSQRMNPQRPILPSTVSWIRELESSPAGTMFAVSVDTLYLSDDEGLTWTSWDLSHDHVVNVRAGSGRLVLANVEILLRSINSGQIWASQGGRGLPPSALPKEQDMVFNPVTGSWYVAMHKQGTPYHLYTRSRDNALSWTDVIHPWSEAGVHHRLYVNPFTGHLFVNHRNDTTNVSTFSISRDEGDSWIPIRSFSDTLEVVDFVPYSDRLSFIIAADGRVFYLWSIGFDVSITPGFSWPAGARFLRFDHAGGAIMVANDQRIYSSTVVDTSIAGAPGVVEAGSGLEIHPNPAGTMIVVRAPSGCTRIDLCSTLGEIITSIAIDPHDRDRSTAIELGSLPPGAYMIRSRCHGGADATELIIIGQ